MECQDHLHVDIDKRVIIFFIHSDCMKEGGGNVETSDKSQLVLKCDLQERILDPALFGATVQQQMVSALSLTCTCTCTCRDIDTHVHHVTYLHVHQCS